jgi:hypothetical protein
VVLGRKVAEERALAGVGPIGDLLDGGRLETLLLKELKRRPIESLTGLEPFAIAPRNRSFLLVVDQSRK